MQEFLQWFMVEGKTYIRYFLLLPFLIGLLRIRHLSKAQRWLWGLILLGMGTEICSVLFYRMGWLANNLPFFHLYTLGEGLLLLAVMQAAVPTLMPRRLYQGIMLGYSLLTGISLLFFQGPMEVNSLIRTIEAILMILLALWFFRFTLQHLQVEALGKSFPFWIAITLLLYFSANLLLFIYSSAILGDSWESEGELQIFRSVWSLYSLMNLLMYLLYSIALLCKDPLPSSKSSWSAP
ncbi:MAG: hypothetical protein AAF399_03580 [Bacteroidota bacterium]